MSDFQWTDLEREDIIFTRESGTCYVVVVEEPPDEPNTQQWCDSAVWFSKRFLVAGSTIGLRIDYRLNAEVLGNAELGAFEAHLLTKAPATKMPIEVMCVVRGNKVVYVKGLEVKA